MSGGKKEDESAVDGGTEVFTEMSLCETRSRPQTRSTTRVWKQTDPKHDQDDVVGLNRTQTRA